MRRLWLASGTIAMLMIFAIILARTARENGITSPHLLRSAVICAAVAAIALTVRYLRERHSWSTGPRPNHQTPCNSN